MPAADESKENISRRLLLPGSGSRYLYFNTCKTDVRARAGNTKLIILPSPLYHVPEHRCLTSSDVLTLEYVGMYPR